ncbi:MAG: C4-dicarboxylate ABC transporter substrate-binding protein [Deltaproteobacteria bacterium SM23_61]|nr:MAG: C4-dicarboxylate ABC transporter substrate-binding protein [Deltaproteobacteria bacterium SM23_61]
MKSKMIILLIVCFFAGFIFHPSPTELQAKPIFITIGSGDFTGVYFPTGLAIAKMINKKRKEYGIRATVESTRGSVFNVKAMMAGYLEFGLVQSDKQYQAVKGLAEWAEKGPQKELLSVFSLHRESVCLVAAVDAGIKTINDLRGKRVNLGNPGSGQYRNSIDALEAVGINPNRDMDPETAKASEAPGLLQDNRIDAFFCTVGHPSETLKMATSGERKVLFIPITGPGIDRLAAEKHYYTKTTVPVAQFYPGAKDPVDVGTFSVIATLCTSSRMPADVVYTITKEIFDNFEEFKRQHPALGVLKKREMLKGVTAPFHPGAIKYFREVGLMK